MLGKYLTVVLLALFINSVEAKSKSTYLLRPRSFPLLLESYQIFADFDQFSTTGNYDLQGIETPLDGGSTFTKNDSNVSLSYGYSKVLSFTGGIRYRKVRTVNSFREHTNQGMESYVVGLKYSLPPTKKMIYSLIAEYRNTSYTNDSFTTPTDEDIILGDDGSSYRFGAVGSYLYTHGVYLTGSLEFQAPSNSLSSELIYDLAANWVGSKWAFNLGVNGIKSLQTDQFTDTPESKPGMNTGETALFNSINREKIAPYAEVFRSFDVWKVGLRAETIMSGISTDKGHLLAANFTWNFGGKDYTTRKISKFKEYNIDAQVTKVSPREKFLKIDKGASGDLEKGMVVDIYKTDYFDGNVLVASGKVFELNSNNAIIKVTIKHKPVRLKKGFTVRAQ